MSLKREQTGRGRQRLRHAKAEKCSLYVAEHEQKGTCRRRSGPNSMILSLMSCHQTRCDDNRCDCSSPPFLSEKQPNCQHRFPLIAQKLHPCSWKLRTCREQENSRGKRGRRRGGGILGAGPFHFGHWFPEGSESSSQVDHSACIPGKGHLVTLTPGLCWSLVSLEQREDGMLYTGC